MKRLNEYKNKIRILVIEDESLAAQKIVKVLSKYYNNITLANNGEEALEVYKNAFVENKPIDVVISDINMPKIDGIELLERVREFDDTLPFIYVSANLTLKTLLKLVKLDIVNFLEKPVDVDELINSVNKVVLTKYKALFFKDNHIENVLEVGKDLYWDTQNKSLSSGNTVFKLTKNEILLIEILTKNQNSIVTTENIIYYIWEDSSNTSSISNLKNLISRLRIKVPTLDLENVYGLGYKIRTTYGKQPK